MVMMVTGDCGVVDGGGDNVHYSGYDDSVGDDTDSNSEKRW